MKNINYKLITEISLHIKSFKLGIEIFKKLTIDNIKM